MSDEQLFASDAVFGVVVGSDVVRVRLSVSSIDPALNTGILSQIVQDMPNAPLKGRSCIECGLVEVVYEEEGDEGCR